MSRRQQAEACPPCSSLAPFVARSRHRAPESGSRRAVHRPSLPPVPQLPPRAASSSAGPGDMLPQSPKPAVYCQRGVVARPGRRLLVRCAHGSCRRTVVASSHTSFNSRHELRGHHVCHRLPTAAWLTAWLTAAASPHFDTQPFAFRVLRTSLEAVAHASVCRAATVGSIIRRPR